MHCTACEKLVTLTTKKVPGVVAAEGDTPTSTVTVTVDGPVALEALAAAIKAAGFTPGDPLVLADEPLAELPGADPPAGEDLSPVAPAQASVAEERPRSRGARSPSARSRSVSSA